MDGGSGNSSGGSGARPAPVGGARGKRRRNRTLYTSAQVAVLQAAFSQDPYPDIDQREKIAARIDVAESRVQTWFQNARSRTNRKARRAVARVESGETSGQQGQSGPTPGQQDQQETTPADHAPDHAQPEEQEREEEINVVDSEEEPAKVAPMLVGIFRPYDDDLGDHSRSRRDAMPPARLPHPLPPPRPPTLPPPSAMLLPRLEVSGHGAMLAPPRFLYPGPSSIPQAPQSYAVPPPQYHHAPHSYPPYSHVPHPLSSPYAYPPTPFWPYAYGYRL